MSERRAELEIVDGRVVSAERARLTVEFEPGARADVGAWLQGPDTLAEVVALLNSSEVGAVVRAGMTPSVGQVLRPAERPLVPTFSAAAGSAVRPLTLPSPGREGVGSGEAVPLDQRRHTAAEPPPPTAVVETGWTGLDLYAPLPSGGALGIFAAESDAVAEHVANIASALAHSEGYRVLWVSRDSRPNLHERWVHVDGRDASDAEWALAGRAATSIARTVESGPLLVVLDRPEAWLASSAADEHPGGLSSIAIPDLLRAALYQLEGAPSRPAVCAILDPGFLSTGRGERGLADVFDSIAIASGRATIDPTGSTSRMSHPLQALGDATRALLADDRELRQHIAIFGEEDLEPDSWALLEKTARLSHLLAATGQLEAVRALLSDDLAG